MSGEPVPFECKDGYGVRRQPRPGSCIGDPLDETACFAGDTCAWASTPGCCACSPRSLLLQLPQGWLPEEPGMQALVWHDSPSAPYRAAVSQHQVDGSLPEDDDGKEIPLL